MKLAEAAVHRRTVILTSCMLVGLLFCLVEGKAIASSSESPSLNEIATKVKTSTAEPHPSTTLASSENDLMSSSYGSSASSTILSNEILPTEASINSTSRAPDASPASPTADTVPDLNRNQVSLDLPDDLFSSTANLTLQLRNFIGDFITRTSVRIAQVVRFFQPLFGYHLMIDIPKEMDV